jgi:hypothetical protein
VARVALQPAQVERGLGQHLAAQVPRRLARLAPGAPAAHIHVHQHVEHEPGVLHGPAELVHVVGVIHHRQGLGLAPEHAQEPADLLGPDHLGGDEEIAHAGGGHHLGLAHLCHADTDRAGRDLAARDLRALVGLRMRAELLAGGLHVGRHLLDIALEAVEV